MKTNATEQDIEFAFIKEWDTHSAIALSSPLVIATRVHAADMHACYTLPAHANSLSAAEDDGWDPSDCECTLREWGTRRLGSTEGNAKVDTLG